MHAVAHQITHQAMVAAVASAAAGNNLEGEAWEGATVHGGGCCWLAGMGRALSPLRSLFLPCTGQQVPGFPTAPTRVVIARPTPPQARPSHPGGPPVSGALVRNGGEFRWAGAWEGSCGGHGKGRIEPPVSQQGAGVGSNASLAQMVSGLVGQLLMQPVLVGESSFLPASK